MIVGRNEEDVCLRCDRIRGVGSPGQWARLIFPIFQNNKQERTVQLLLNGLASNKTLQTSITNTLHNGSSQLIDARLDGSSTFQYF